MSPEAIKVCYSIFFYDGYVGIAPTIINLTKIFVRQNASVDIYGTKNTYPSPGYLGENVNIAYFLKGTRLFDYLQKKGIKSIIPLGEFLFYFIPCFQKILPKTIRNISQSKRSINIAVDLYGAITALFFFLIFQQKFLFLSLELHDPNNYQGISRILTFLAKLAAQKSEAIIIQDQDRFQTFCKFYDYYHPQVFYLPNSTLAETDHSKNISENFFRQKFNLDTQQFPYILLQAGMIADAVYSQTLAQTFNQIEDKYALIFHDRSPRQEDPYIQKLRQTNTHNLFLSLEPVPYNQLDEIYQAADIGLAFYQDLSDNFSQIALASGKLPQYLKQGKPVLVNNLPSLQVFVEKYQIGQVINDPTDPQEIQIAIAKILDNYEFYQNNALVCFSAEFDFGNKVKPLLEFIQNNC